MNKRLVVVLAITLLIVAPIIAIIFATTNLSTIGIGDGVWQLQPKITGLTVDDVDDPSSGLYYRRFDPDSNCYTQPLIMAELTNLRKSDTPPVDMGAGWTTYELLFDICFKTDSSRWSGTLGYEGVEADISLDFRVDVQKGIFAEVPDAMVTDITVGDYESGLIAFPGYDPAWIQTYVVDSWAPGSIGPIMSPHQSAGVPLFTGGTTTSAEASLGCGLRAGFQAHTGTAFCPTCIAYFTAYDVYALYTVEVEIKSSQGIPAIDPLADFLRILSEWSYNVKTGFEAFLELFWNILSVWAPIIAIGIFVIVLFFIYIRYKRK